jgi:hypothetical protein
MSQPGAHHDHGRDQVVHGGGPRADLIEPVVHRDHPQDCRRQRRQAGEAPGLPPGATPDQERLIDTAVVDRRVDEPGGLSPTLTIESVRDRIWTLNSVERWHRVTVTLS